MFLAVLAAAAHGAPLTLEGAIAIALSANLEHQQDALALERQRATWLGVVGQYDPVLAASVDTGASTIPSNVAIEGTDRIVSRSAGWSTSVNQLLPSGGSAGLYWSETFFDSNSASLVSASTVSDRLALTVSQPLLAGLRTPMLSVRSASLALTDEELALRASTERLVLDTAAGYWRLVSGRESHVLAVRSREIAEQSLVDARERLAEGFAGSADVLQVERALGSARQAEVIAAAEVEAADMALRRLLGEAVTPGVVLDPVDRPVVPATLPGFDEVLAAARAANAEWRRQQLAYDRAAIDVKLARNAVLPDLTATGSVGLTGLAPGARGSRRQIGSAENNDWGLGASVSVPLPGRPIRAGLTAAALDRDRAALALEAAEQDLVIEVQAAVRAAERDRLRVTLAEDTVRVARLALEADQELHHEGRGSTRDVVLSLEALDQAQVEFLQAQIDLQASLLELRRVAGTVVP
jgi:outer membrane protein